MKGGDSRWNTQETWFSKSVNYCMTIARESNRSIFYKKGVYNLNFEIVGSSADFHPKRPLKKRIKDLNPIWFVKTSLSFMEGYSKWHIWSRMPIVYIRYCISCLKG